MKIYIYLLLVLFLCFGCKDPDFFQVNEDIKRKLIVFGEGKTTFKNATCIDLDYCVETISDNEPVRKKNHVFLTDANSRMFGITDLAQDLNGLVSGDSVLYILNYGSIKNHVLDEFVNDGFFLTDTATVNLTIKCNLAMTEGEYLAYKEQKVREGLKLEMELIQEYMEAKKITNRYKRKGDLFYMKTKEMSSRATSANSDVAVSYTCSFLNGKVFQSVTKDDPQYLNLNSPDQLIKGLLSVVKEMNEGEECRVIIPSYLAFGEKGSSDGTVPPKTPILVDVKLLEIY